MFVYTKKSNLIIIISGPLYRACTDQLQKELRHIDRVTVKGSIEPLGNNIILSNK